MLSHGRSTPSTSQSSRKEGIWVLHKTRGWWRLKSHCPSSPGFTNILTTPILPTPGQTWNYLLIEKYLNYKSRPSHYSLHITTQSENRRSPGIQPRDWLAMCHYRKTCLSDILHWNLDPSRNTKISERISSIQQEQQIDCKANSTISYLNPVAAIC